MRDTKTRITAIATLALLAAALTGCQETTGADSSAPYPCGRTIASADRFAGSTGDIEKDPEGVARSANDLAGELRDAGKKTTDAGVRSALGEFADVYDEFAGQIRTSDPSGGRVAGLEKTFTKLEAAGDRLDRACAA
ncbi:hypothetical protein AMK16_29735 [Streptomyces sp. CB00455]|uniref:hypothetical protein n=1 Tax=Streptomyces sp. CB00455 TaxID=1703927 RepID=UPI00093A7788|nr:hypothetical protein [Streptomyces sp. CB00455]OKK14734.1 hypothetical protein AMK16_29735 [Streptomyces sp. CB00455]